jgi:hypothetical protein
MVSGKQRPRTTCYVEGREDEATWALLTVMVM